MLCMTPGRLVVIVGGLGLLTALVVSVGLDAVTTAFSTLSWRLGIVVVMPFMLVNIFDTLGWRFAFPRDLVSFPTLWRARLAGEAVNTTTPTATVGGEAVKAWLLRPRVPYDEALASVVIAKTTITVAQGLFLLLGLLLVTGTPADGRFLTGMRWLLVVEVLAVTGFVAVQVSGVVGGAVRALGQRFSLPSAVARSADVGRVEEMLRRFYTRQPSRLALSIAAHFLGWAISAMEIWLVLHFLGTEVSFVTALVLEAFATAIKFIAFWVPGGIGTSEGGLVLVFVAFGLGAPLGLSFALVRRLREVCWTAAGLLVLMALGGGRRRALSALRDSA
jgi:putative membrane protein